MSERDFTLLLACNYKLRVRQTQRKKSVPQVKQSPKELSFDSEAEQSYYYKVITPSLKDSSIYRHSRGQGQKNQKLRPDYPIRRLLFITNFCNPNEWDFFEVFDDEI